MDEEEEDVEAAGVGVGVEAGATDEGTIVLV